MLMGADRGGGHGIRAAQGGPRPVVTRRRPTSDERPGTSLYPALKER